MIGFLLNALLGVALHSVPAAPANAAAVGAPDDFAMAMVPATRAKAFLPGLFSTDDYPQAALRNREQGTVAYALSINRDGRVTRCSVTRSSGSAILDRTTCSIIQRRARFEPARNAQGGAVEDVFSGRIAWNLPVPPAIRFADRHERVILTLGANSEVTNCRAEASDNRQAPSAICGIGTSIAKQIIANFGRRTDFRKRLLVLESGMQIDAPKAALKVGRGAGEHLVTLTALVLNIDANGAITSCVAANGNKGGANVDAECARAAKIRFAALLAADRGQPQRYATIYEASFTKPLR